MLPPLVGVSLTVVVIGEKWVTLNKDSNKDHVWCLVRLSNAL
jgi:hypothetical protein